MHNVVTFARSNSTVDNSYERAEEGMHCRREKSLVGDRRVTVSGRACSDAGREFHVINGANATKLREP